MTLNAERFEYTNPLRMGDEVFHVRSMIPYEEKERMA